MYNYKITCFLLFLLIGISNCKSPKVVVIDKNYISYEVDLENNFPSSDAEEFITDQFQRLDNNEINLSSQTLKLSPKSYKSWRTCLQQNKGIHYFLLEDGDYSNWGVFEPSISGTPRQQKYLLSTSFVQTVVSGKKEHPYHQAINKKGVILENFRLKGCSFWVFSGIIFNGHLNVNKYARGGMPNSMRDGSNHNLVDHCFFKDINRGSAVRLLNANNNTVQNSVFEQTSITLTGDNVAILISAHTGKTSIGNNIINNEIINWNDGIAILRQQFDDYPQNSQTGDCAKTLIENNDIYITPKLYIKKNGETLACAENAIDNKQGSLSNDPEDKIIIRNNRMWGFRQAAKEGGSSGSPGTAIVIHRAANNMLLENNIIFDVAMGIMISGINPTFPNESVKNIEVKNNLFYDINKHSKFQYEGAAFYVFRGNVIEGNIIANTVTPIIYRIPRTKNYFQDNLLINCKQYTAPKSKFDFRRNNQRVNQKNATQEFQDFIFYRKQWTSPEKIIFKNIIPN